MASGTIKGDVVIRESFALSGFDSNFVLQRIGKICFITYNGTASNLSNGELPFSQVLPERFIPSVPTSLATNSSTGEFNVCVLLTLNQDGTIVGYNYKGAITSRTACRFGTVSYVAAN